MPGQGILGLDCLAVRRTRICGSSSTPLSDISDDAQ